MNFVIYLVVLCVVVAKLDSLESKSWCNNEVKGCRCRETTNPKHMPSFDVDCSRNDIWIFPLQTYLPEVLDCLDLSHNSLTFLPEDIQLTSQTLRVFHLEYNHLRKLPANFFKSISKLEYLDLSYNEIADIEFDAFQGLENLKYLNLAVNSITTFSYQTFRPLRSLKTLSLSHNRIGDILKNIDMFAVTKLGVTVNLTELNLDNTYINSLSAEFFQNAKRLQKLTLSNNPMQDFPVVSQSVKYLDLSGTNINKLSTQNLNYHNLKTLILHGMPFLKTIEDYAFYNLQSLQKLEINDCHGLQELNPMAFGPLVTDNETVSTTLRKFSLARNGLMSLNDSYYNLFEQLDYINLEGNPWTCNCEFLWIQQLNKTAHRKNFTRCYLPWSMKNRLLFELNEDDLPCASTVAQALLPIFGSLVVILIVLIAYLIYMGPFTYRKYFYIAQESPYNGMTVLPAGR